MKISVDWLSDYIDVSALRADPAAAGEKLTMRGLEVEAIHDLSAGLAKIVSAQVVEKLAHPNANKLSLCKVSDGKTTHQIVCGAQNFKQGDKVVLALIGAALPNGLNIQASKIRDVESFGMLCSEEELGLKDKADGLLILPQATELGKPIAEVLGKTDIVFEINVTPNRGDALSHIGVAREFASILGVALKIPVPRLNEVSTQAGASLKVQIESGEGCMQYHGRVMQGVKVGPSPAWMVKRLEACGIRSISNIVDVTNYVQLEWGTPLHAFDLDKITEKTIKVRLAKAGENIALLDDTSVVLTDKDLVIADAQNPVAIAGVMGGASSQVTEATQNIIIEAAEFNAAFVRRTSKRLLKHTEAAHRYERRIDPLAVPRALDRAASLMAELSGGKVLSGQVNQYAKGYEDHCRQLKDNHSRVVIDVAVMNKFLGLDLTVQQAADALSKAGFRCDGVGGSAGGSATNLVTFHASNRPDVVIAEDFYEEVLRVVGYDKVHSIVPKLPKELEALGGSANAANTRARSVLKVKQMLSSLGFSEAVNFAFESAETAKAWAPASAAFVTLKNPLNEEFTTLKTTLLSGLYSNLLQAVRFQNQNVKLFEIRPVYFKDETKESGVREEWRVAVLLTGQAGVSSLQAQDRDADFFEMKGVFESILENLGVRGVRYQDGADQAQERPTYFHPYQSVRLLMGPGPCGWLGMLHPAKLAKDKVRKPVAVLEVSLDRILELAKADRKFAALPKFPKVDRDYTFLVPDQVPAEKLVSAVQKHGKPLAEAVGVIDLFTGGKVPAGHRSLSLSVVYSSKDKTLEDSEIDAVSQKILAGVEKDLGVSLRLE